MSSSNGENNKVKPPVKMPVKPPQPAFKPAEKAQGIPGHKLLRGVLCGVLAFVLAFGVVELALPQQGATADTSRLYDYVYNGVKSESVAFTTANMSSDSILTFGSSEFYISMPLVNQVPQKVFGENAAGVDMTFVGQAFDQSLWHAIAAGAYANSTSNKKVVLMLSPQWFFKGGGNLPAFSSKFSYSLYKDFLSNSNISDETKAYVRERITTQEVDSKQISAANDDTPIDAINDVVFQVSNDLRIRGSLSSIVNGSPLKSDTRVAAEASGESAGEPDWDALLQEAVQQGQESCTNNDCGIYNAYWDKNSQYKTEQGQDFTHADNEWADFKCFLQVCKEAGLEPLVVIIPMHGQWYDHVGVTSETRQQFYDQARSICDEAGVAYADFSSCEYEKYFLCDTVHPGWIGWVRIERAVYDFANGRDDDFLGGAGYGQAKGLASGDGDNGDDDGSGDGAGGEAADAASAAEAVASATAEAATAEAATAGAATAGAATAYGEGA